MKYYKHHWNKEDTVNFMRALHAGIRIQKELSATELVEDHMEDYEIEELDRIFRYVVLVKNPENEAIYGKEILFLRRLEDKYIKGLDVDDAIKKNIKINK